jgi:hypothetical protein
MHSISVSDRDNRRRRMDLAMALLDETQVCDLEAIADIVWLPRGQESKPEHWPESPISTQPVMSDSTQVPTPVPSSVMHHDHVWVEGRCMLCYAWEPKKPVAFDMPELMGHWNCVTQGHRWGDVQSSEGTGWRTCLACGDQRTL